MCLGRVHENHSDPGKQSLVFQKSCTLMSHGNLAPSWLAASVQNTQVNFVQSVDTVCNPAQMKLSWLNDQRVEGG